VEVTLDHTSHSRLDDAGDEQPTNRPQLQDKFVEGVGMLFKRLDRAFETITNPSDSSREVLVFPGQVLMIFGGIVLSIAIASEMLSLIDRTLVWPFALLLLTGGVLMLSGAGLFLYLYISERRQMEIRRATPEAIAKELAVLLKASTSTIGAYGKTEAGAADRELQADESLGNTLAAAQSVGDGAQGEMVVR
jgi:hypothetical protein